MGRPRTNIGPCSVSACSAPSRTKGLCERHYKRLWRHGDTSKSERGDVLRGASVEDRFWHRVKKTDTCWLWTGSKHSGGYGRFKVSGTKTVYPHRFAYELLVGPIPSDEEAGYRVTIDHLCGVRLCVNPKHLEVVSMSENLKRRVVV